jgi:hypothetical protein
VRLFADPLFDDRPLEAARRYAWLALRGDWKSTAIILATLLVLTLLQAVPLLGMLASLAQGLIVYGLGWWIVDLLRRTDSESAFAQALPAEAPTRRMGGYLAPAAGYYTGVFVLSLIIFTLAGAIFALTGGSEFAATAEQWQQNGVHTQAEAAAAAIQLGGEAGPTIAFMLLATLLLSYVWPLSYGYALSQTDFGGAFKAAFAIFSPRFWRASFTGRYFKTVSIWMLIVFGAAIGVAFCMATLLLAPVGIGLLLWLVLYTAIVAAALYHAAPEI